MISPESPEPPTDSELEEAVGWLESEKSNDLTSDPNYLDWLRRKA